MPPNRLGKGRCGCASGTGPIAAGASVEATGFEAEHAPGPGGRMSGSGRVPVGLAGLGGAAVCAAAFAALWPSGEMSTDREIALKAVASLALLSLLAAAEWGRLGARAARIAVVSCAVLALFAYFNFGRFHHPQFVHWWEQFHYQLGSKYFPELGYDGLYDASITAQRATAPRRLLQPRYRDLRDNRVKPTRGQLDRAAQVAQRFEPERWQAFLADHRTFLDALPLGYLAEMRQDHGYNPTPAWTFVARLFNARLPLGRGTLVALGLLDPLLLAAMFAVLFRTFGWRRGCLALVVFGLGYAARFKWTGGAFLRLDWLAALGLAVAAAERRRPFAAGAGIGYAAAVRLFPAAFLLGPALLGLRGLLRRRRPDFALRLGAGFVAAFAVMLLAGACTGRGAAAWSEFAGRMRVYQVSWAPNSVGLEGLVLYGGEAVSRSIARGDEAWGLQREDVARLRREERWPVRAAQLGLLALTALAMWSATPACATALGMVAVFALTPSACYYWAMLSLAPLVLGRREVAALLVFNTALYGVHGLVGQNLLRYALLSWGLLGVFVLWLTPRARRTLRSARAG